MSPENWYEKPQNYFLAGIAVLLSSAVLCTGGKEEVRQTKSEELQKSEDTALPPQVDPFAEALKKVLSQVEEEPSVSLHGKSPSLYLMEEALAECIQMEDNTCYLSYDYSLMFRTRLQCYSNTWGKFSKPVSFAVRPDPESGVTINMHLPNDEVFAYNSAPNVVSNPDEAEEFYTEVCRTAIQALHEKPDQSACTYPQDYEVCREMEDNEERASLLTDEVEFGFETLKSEDFNVETTSANTLRLSFENLDGSVQTETFFPKPSSCDDEEASYDGTPCWTFRTVTGGEYTPDEILDYAVNKQLLLLEE